MRPLLSVCLFVLLSPLSAQYSIEGRVTNEDGESLVSAVVFVPDSDYAAVTDDSGQYRLDGLEADSYRIKSTYLGYKAYEQEIELKGDMRLDIVLEGSKYRLDEIEIRANQLQEESPFSFVEISRKDIELKNAAQDLPFLLEYNPSMVVTSDAGAGIGYTSMRVRGSDATRVNVTVNGVPINDSESHGVFWVNMPDFASSVDNIQLQRGVGPSTNGAASFGATLAMNTNRIKQNPHIHIDGTYGSFNTRKLSFGVNTGLINERWNLEGRYSIIKSDGYVDRASSDLKSYYFSLARIGEKGSIRFNTFSGSERTYQSWWGVPEAKLEGDDEALRAHYLNNRGIIYQTAADSINLFDSDRRYNYYLYDNQVDDYRQDHYQFIWAHQAKDSWSLNLTAHYTRGSGFFEEFRHAEDFASYGLDPVFNSDGDEVLVSDLVRRRWLDNHFMGLIFNNTIRPTERLELLLGASSNVYLGDHFGNVIYAEDAIIENPDYRYYFSDATKWDHNVYGKLNWQAGEKLKLFVDMQARKLSYETMGTDNDLRAIDVDTSYLFLNPKFGISYQRDNESQYYFSLARSEREPVRSDFIDAIGTEVPKSEKLWDLEAGQRYQGESYSLNSNLYYMYYHDQLVLTGAVNDVGAPVRTNVDRSYRLGIELDGTYRFSERFQWNANLNLSQNKIKFFEEQLPDYLNGGVALNEFENSTISFSPGIIMGSTIQYAFRQLNFSLLSKYVGRQYLDNTGNAMRSIDPYFYSDLVVTYKPKIQGFEAVHFKLLINNFFDSRYASNGYSYSYLFGDLITENFYYPQAGRNLLLQASFNF